MSGPATRSVAALERIEIRLRRQPTFEVVAVALGKLPAKGAKLGTPRQIVIGRVVEIELPVYVPLTDKPHAPAVPEAPGADRFELPIVIHTLGLGPGLYTAVVNGLKATFEIPPP